MSKFFLKLYIAGRTPTSELAIANLRRLSANELKYQYELLVIDVLEQPQLARQEKILATPSLVKTYPLPRRQVTGDLSNTRQVLLGLDLAGLGNGNGNGMCDQ